MLPVESAPNCLFSRWPQLIELVEDFQKNSLQHRIAVDYPAQGVAIDHGFSDALIETREGLAVTTAAVFAVLALGRAGAVRLGFGLVEARGRLVAAPTIDGIALLPATAYRGDHFV